MTTTTANAVNVLEHIEYATQVLWPELDVRFCSATDQWCAIAVAGPSSRTLLQRLLGAACDLADEALPYMGLSSFQWHDVPVRIYRISFSGELAYEINVPADFGASLWQTLLEQGADLNIAPYGVEALNVLRIEKGHITGNELNGQTTANDLGLGRMVSMKKHCIGQPLAQRPGLSDPARARLVGIELIDGAERLHGGMHLVPEDALSASAGAESQGHLSSVAFSPVRQRWIGLALLRHGADRHGETLLAVSPLHASRARVKIVHPVFHDAAGERLRDASAADIKTTDTKTTGTIMLSRSSRLAGAEPPLPYRFQATALRPHALAQCELIVSDVPKLAMAVALSAAQTAPESDNDLCFLSIAPGEFLVSSSTLTEPRLQTALRERWGNNVLLSTQSAARCVFRLEGEAAAHWLMRGCSLDLLGRDVEPGWCAQTQLAHVGVMLHRVESNTVAFEISVYSSYAQHLLEWLVFNE